MQTSVLILYDPKDSTIIKLADGIAKGVENHNSTRAILKSIESATTTDLIDSDGIILGSPNWSGITGTFKGWLDNQGDLWEEGCLAGKPGCIYVWQREALWIRDHIIPANPLDASLRDVDCRFALVKCYERIRLILRRNRDGRWNRIRLNSGHRFRI